MLEIIRKNRYWLIANVIGILLFLFFAARLWPNLKEQDIPLEMRTSDGLVSFIGTCLPVLLVFSLVNIFWFFEVFAVFTTKKKPSLVRCSYLLLWIFVGLSWIIAFRYDRSRAWTESPRVEELRAKGVLNFGD